MASEHPDFVLRLAGKPYTGWTEMQLARAIDRMSGEFNVSMTHDPDHPFLQENALPGTACSVEIDGKPVLVGYIDALSDDYDASNQTVRISGRDKIGDLIDCAATVNGPFEYPGQKLDGVVRKILKPYGIPVRFEGDMGAPFKRAAIQPGETAFEFIERLCRFRAVMPVSDGVGGLVILKPGKTRSAGALVYGQNVLTGAISMDGRSRFSLYVVKAQAEADSETGSSEASGPEGRAVDPAIRRYRPTVMLGESQGFSGTLKERAAWQMRVNRARSITAEYSVQGWYADPDQKILWLPNTIVKVIDKARRTNRDMLITGVTYLRGSGGTRTVLALTIPEAFELEAEVEDAGSDVMGAGL